MKIRLSPILNKKEIFMQSRFAFFVFIIACLGHLSGCSVKYVSAEDQIKKASEIGQSFVGKTVDDVMLEYPDTGVEEYAKDKYRYTISIQASSLFEGTSTFGAEGYNEGSFTIYLIPDAKGVITTYQVKRD